MDMHFSPGRRSSDGRAAGRVRLPTDAVRDQAGVRRRLPRVVRTSRGG